MEVLIKGIRIGHLSITRDKENGMLKFEGAYQLISSSDIVLATQTFNGYNDLKIMPSSATQKALNDFVNNLTSDVNSLLGLEEKK